MNRREFISRIRLSGQAVEKGLFCLLILLCLAVTAKTIGGFFQKRSISGRVAASMELLDAQNSKAKEYLEAYGKDVGKLKEKGIFCPEKKKPSPPQVSGILGDSALINNKWCKVGEEQSGAKILKIEPTQVTILWEGKEMKLSPLLTSSSGNAIEKPKMKIEKRRPNEKGIKKHPKPSAEPVAVQAADDPLAWLGMEVSAELRAFLIKLFEAMPADQVENAKQEWANMSEEQKKKRLDEAQEMVDSGQAETMLEQMKASQG
ncbi:MAG: hypothetical protein ACYSOZ_03975 [Planctomycetota bacterium]|jgi:F0F1-type ATP synthase membrane subunit b/b'